MWEKVKFIDIVQDVTGGNKKLNQSKYLEVGKFPIIDQGEKFIGGYSDDDLTIKVSKPVVVFGDHSKCIKFIDFDFIMGADGVKVLEPLQNLDSKYLFYFLKTIKLPNVGYSRHFKFLKESIIPLPPLPIQEKIAEILDKADELRRKDKDLRAKYDELAQAIFIDMFGDPVRNEKGWDKALLKEFYKNGVKCGPFGSALKKEEFKQNGVPVWNMDNIQSFEFLDLPSLFVSEEKYISLKQYEVVNGDIIISRAGTVGKMCVVDSTFKKSLLSTNLIKLSLDDCMLKSLFFVYLMKFFSKRLGRLKTGGEDGFTHMNTGVLNNLEIYVPPIHLQEAFAKKIELINRLKAQTNAEKSEELFQSLLQKAFKGELVS